MAADQAVTFATLPARRADSKGSGGSSKAVTPDPFNGAVEPVNHINSQLAIRESRRTVTPPASADELLKRRGSSCGSMNIHKSWRYDAAKTHAHFQRDTVRQYRKTVRGWHCPVACCSRRSSTGFWVDSHQAHGAAYTAIFLNTVFFIFQAYFEDHLTSGDSLQTDRAVYCVVQVLFMIVFSVELLLRMRAQPSQDAIKWNRFDAAFLAICFLDACILNFTPAAEPAHSVIVRLLPTLAVLRLGRFVQEFRMIIKGIFSAMRAVLWSLCLLALVIYFFAVLCATCIGRSKLYQGDGFVFNLFGSLPKAMFSLFTFATLEDFPDAVRHFMDGGETAGVVIAVAIVIFILFTNLSLLNLVTAVMVDTIIDILPKKHTEKLAQERADTVHRLEAIFLKMDKDGDRKLTLPEFKEGVDNFVEVQNELSMLQIAYLDIGELFSLLDFNENGAVAVDEFIDGLLRMVPTPASKKELLGIEYDMHKMWNMLGSGQEHTMASLDLLHEKLSANLDRERQATFENCVRECCGQVESCVRECCSQVERQLKEQLDHATAQLLAGQRQLLEVARGADGSQALAQLQRSLEALPLTLAEDRQKALDGQRKGVLDALEAKLPTRAADAAELSRMGRLIEELKERQQQLLDVAAAARPCGAEVDQSAAAASASRRSPSPSPTCQRTRPPPLQASCLGSITTNASAADAGPEPEPPHSVLQTPANRTFMGLPTDLSLGLRPGPPLVSMPEARALSSGHLSQEYDQRSRSAPVPPPRASLVQLPPPQFFHAAMASPTRVAPDVSSFSSGLVCCQQPTMGRELQALLQAILASQTMPAAALAAGCMPQSQGQGRVALVQQWVRQQGWAGAPFDKLVLHLDRLGVELSEAEQDALQLCLRHPASGPAM